MSDQSYNAYDETMDDYFKSNEMDIIEHGEESDSDFGLSFKELDFND